MAIFNFGKCVLTYPKRKLAGLKSGPSTPQITGVKKQSDAEQGESLFDVRMN